ncbi:MAG: hypothetical protein QNK92_11655 [Amylibacter sp.]
MFKQLLIGETIAAAAGYTTISGLHDVLNFSSRGDFSASGGAKCFSAKFTLGNISFTSLIGGPRINNGSTNSNSNSALNKASQAELARKRSNNYLGSAKNI